MAWLSQKQVAARGFKSIGAEVLLSSKVSLYNCERISLGSRVRIDDFCVLAAGDGGVQIGSNVHLGVGCSLVGRGKIVLSDFSGLSSRVAIYSSSDDYSGFGVTNPTVPSEFRAVTHADVFLQNHVIVGAGSVILPGVVLEEGVAVGALSVIRKNCTAWGIYAGNPARRVAERNRDLLQRAQDYLDGIGSS